MKKAPEPENKSKPEPAADALLRAKTPDPDPAPLPPKKKFTPKAASQFKSPFSSSPSPALSAVRLTPTIQTLERRIQVLKRAVKVQQDGEAGTLEGLVRKWTEAGREVAWEVWEAVKDNSEGDGKGAGGKGGWGSDDKKGGWGYDEKPGEEGGWGAEEDYKGKPRAHEEEEEEKTTDTLGTMLRQLGIAPETLGWDEDEGEFVDV
ncbi:hypothetical protein PLICRDRAFT_231933 [Plicaturopsis crispa FD-325 SS-3]|nr:hypothetical protein PLICRDRAFT_231933 [Plicaturopsis crispa FD-325 SS-3]